MVLSAHWTCPTMNPRRSDVTIRNDSRKAWKDGVQNVRRTRSYENLLEAIHVYGYRESEGVATMGT